MKTVDSDEKTPALDHSCAKAATDISRVYAAEDFLRERPVEPWAEESFMTVVDISVNYTDFYYPHPTKKSLKDAKISGNLPPFLVQLDTFGVIKSYDKAVAEELRPSNHHLIEVFGQFTEFALNETRNLKEFLNFHFLPENKERHIGQMGEKRDIQDFVKNFVAQQNEPKVLSEKIEVAPIQLSYAFDVFYRGQQYDEILGGIPYFNHPLRDSLFRKRLTERIRFSNLPTWGRCLARLIHENKFSRKVDEVTDFLRQLKENIRVAEIGWEEWNSSLSDPNKVSELEDKVKEVAANVGLPALASKELLMLGVSGVGLGVDALLGTGGLVTFLLEAGTWFMAPENFYIPGKLGKIDLLRAKLIWPDLLETRGST
jgi:hypothetical protein